jgi:hypothetical protein
MFCDGKGAVAETCNGVDWHDFPYGEMSANVNFV